jgi:CheY-like chemotaxis protein/HPt (histidine-containing phosphotransfer) domain-containing protein
MSAAEAGAMAPAKILVVDDEAHGRLALQALLAGADREVIAAASGEAALREVATADFALLLLDVRMAGMDGFETARLIRRCPRAELTPIIFLTGAYEDMASVMRGYAAGAVDYVVKPFLPDVLRSKVAVFVDLYYKNAELGRQIQERQKAEEALSRANEELELRIRERTESLTAANEMLRREVAMRKRIEGELRVAKQAAEAANSAKTEFLANMSHEIRTPMNAIVGMTELALQANTSPEVQEYLSGVKASSASLIGIIDDILDLSKIEAGRLTVESIPFRLRDCVGDAVRTLAVQAHEKSLELVCDIADAVPDALLGDPLRLRQIVINLVGNGIKFTQQGEVALTVAVAERSVGEVTCQFSVRDTGIGIPKDRQGAIFRRFLQGDTATARLYGGSGLGLTISARLVEMMNGRIWVESDTDRGSRFHFTARFPVQSGADLTPTGMDLDGVHVLVVDDHPGSRRVVADWLRQWHAVVHEADTGARALRLLRERTRTRHPIDIVLVDDTLPDRENGTVVERMTDRRLPRKPIIITLGFGGRRTETGPALMKPVKRAELLEALHALRGTLCTTRQAPAAERVAPACKLRVLLVEDNPLSRKLAHYVLRKHGHDVAMAEDGAAALEMYDRQPFDVVLMDIRMPRMDGLQATQAIREREKAGGSRIPIIALTANAMVGDREACLQSGMDECLIKPIQPDALLAAIERVRRTTRDRPAAPFRAKVLDERALRERLDGDPELLAAIAGTFSRDSGRLLAKARAALAARDSKGLADAAHTLCGMFRNLCAEAACEAIAELQKTDAADGERSLACLAALESEMRRLDERLTHLAAWRPRIAATSRRGTAHHAKRLA